MEEEGIYYFFKHTKDGHQMVIANTPGSHPDVTIAPTVIYESILGGNRTDYRVFSFQKIQNLTAGKVTLWDHSFELPHKHLEDEEPITETVQVGTVGHKMKLAANAKLELYDFPGAYAQRFDGVDKGGSPRPAELQKIFTDNKRTTKIRIQEEAAQQGILLQGDSDCRQFTSGHKFTIERHFHSDGAYVLTSVKHTATLSSNDYRSGNDQVFEYGNQFTCIPATVPFRPARKHIKPSVLGSQTAVVVGPAGEEIFTDKYGRIKVQFHWDRQGKYDADSSCWIRVAQSWAGKQWGGVFIPRIGMEALIDFLEGDPDQPVCTGCVYNADFMPPYTLPAEKTKSTIKSMTTIGGEGFNELRFEDKKGSEQVFIHAQKNMDIRVKNDRMETIERDRHLEVKRDKFEVVTRDKHIEISQHLTEHVKGDHHLTVDKNESMSVGGALSLTVSGGVNEKFKDVHNEEVGKDYHLKAGMKLVIEAGMGITLQCGGNFINIDPKGVTIVGTMVMINSGGAALTGAPSNPASPQSPTIAKPADKADPGTLLTYSGGGTEKELTLDSSGNAARHDPTSEENKEKKSWIEIVLVDMNNQPIPGERYEIKLPDGETIASGSLDDKGFARVDNIDPGNCKVTFPDLDKDAWEEA
jgi:type VI secretion system secreted protein VgrG